MTAGKGANPLEPEVRAERPIAETSIPATAATAEASAQATAWMRETAMRREAPAQLVARRGAHGDADASEAEEAPGNEAMTASAPSV